MHECATDRKDLVAVLQMECSGFIRAPCEAIDPAQVHHDGAMHLGELARVEPRQEVFQRRPDQSLSRLRAGIVPCDERVLLLRANEDVLESCEWARECFRWLAS